VDNVVDAIVQCAIRKEADGEIFNLVDPEKVSKREYMTRVIRSVDPKARVMYFPYSLLYGITWFQEIVFGLMGRAPVLTRYRLTSSQKSIVYDGGKIANRLGWKPPVPLHEALDRLVRSELSRNTRRDEDHVSLPAHVPGETVGCN
jgi:nucleoside-diphosphate-sugar epimerase